MLSLLRERCGSSQVAGKRIRARHEMNLTRRQSQSLMIAV